MLLFDVSADFNRLLLQACKNARLNEERTKFLVHHERKRLVIDNVCEEVLRYEHRFHSRLDPIQKDKVIKAAVNVFIGAAIKHKEEQLMTGLAKSQIGKTSDVVKEMQNNFKEVSHDG